MRFAGCRLGKTSRPRRGAKHVSPHMWSLLQGDRSAGIQLLAIALVSGMNRLLSKTFPITAAAEATGAPPYGHMCGVSYTSPQVAMERAQFIHV